MVIACPKMYFIINLCTKFKKGGVTIPKFLEDYVLKSWKQNIHFKTGIGVSKTTETKVLI